MGTHENADRAWDAYRGGFSEEERRAFMAGFYSGVASTDTVEEPDARL